MQNQAENLISNAKTVFVGSGKGGVGKSVVATNVAVALQKMGYKVLLFDLDVGFANAEVLLDIT